MKAEPGRDGVEAWKVNFSGRPLFLPDGIEKKGEALLERWAECFPEEKTFIQLALGIPSLVVCVDCAWRNGLLLPYEINDRPYGIGTLFTHSPCFRERFSAVRKTWPPVSVVFTDGARRGDDGAWAENIMRVEDAKAKKPEAVLVRAAFWEDRLVEEFSSVSVFPVKTSGSKLYGVEMGLWRRVEKEEELPWDSGFALKPFCGSGTDCVLVRVPRSEPEYRGAGFTKSHILRVFGEILERDGGMYLQPFIPPMACPEPDKGMYMMYKLYWGFDVAEEEYVFLGGCWNTRKGKQVKIHGASDACFGNLIPADYPAQCFQFGY